MDLYMETSSDESTVQTSERKSFICSYEGCNASFSKSRKLINHVRKHSGERPYECDFEGCTKSYTNSSHLLRHKRTHFEVEKIKCPVERCALIISKTSLKRHIDRMHNPDRVYPFKCEICGGGFHRKRQLKQHIFVHTGELPFQCNICNLKLLTQRDLGRHQRTHTEYKCECNLSFERWSTLRAHKAVCNMSNFICDVCQRSFKRKHILEKHILTHQKVDTREKFECGYENCGRFYYHKRNLEWHIKVFHQQIDRPTIACTYPNCNAQFYQRQKLNNHINRHHTSSSDKTTTKERKPRKDMGIPRKGLISEMTGLTVSKELNKKIVSGELIQNNLDLNDAEMQEQEKPKKTKCINNRRKTKDFKDNAFIENDNKIVDVIGIGKAGETDYVNMQFVVIEYNKPESVSDTNRPTINA